MPFPQKGQGMAWPLMARVFLFDDGLHSVAIVCLDLLFLHTQTVAEFRQAMSAGNGLAPEEIMIACTHTHWGPHTAAIMDEDADFDYIDSVQSRLVQALAEAQASRQPVRLKAARIAAPGWAYNRRPIYRTPQGEQVGTQGPQWIPEFVRLEGPDDPELCVLQIVAEDGASLGGLVNFSCHTTVGPDGPLYTADYPGPLTARLSQSLGGIFGFLQGCAGNIWQMNLTSERDPQHQESGERHTRRMGEALAACAEEALQSAHIIESASVRMARKVLHIRQRRPTREQVELAKRFLEKRPAQIDLIAHMLQIYGHPHTFYSDPTAVQDPGAQAMLLWQEDWFARGILGLWEWQRRTGARELVEAVEVQGIALGDVAFVGYPAEYFVEFGLQTKAHSPFAVTFVSELTNGWHGYVPTREAFSHGGYEPRLGDASRLVEEAGDTLCAAGIELLNQLAG
jgi:hypothetical protein